MKFGKPGVIMAQKEIPISLRCYPDTYKPTKHAFFNDNANNGMVMTLSVEAADNQDQKLRFGSAAVWINEKLYRICLFYDDTLDERKIKSVKEFGEKLQKQKENCVVTVLPKIEFVTRMFYPYVYEARARLVGFDLPYQISRLATSWSRARKMQDAFSMKLVKDNPRLPAIRVKNVDSNSVMIQFVTPLRKKSEKKSVPVSKVYRGCFVDVKTLAYVTTNNSFDGMNDVAKVFGIGIKHCKDAVQDNVQSVLAIHKTYCKIADVLENTFSVR